MSFQVFVLFDFVVQLNIDWMPVEVFMQATPRLLQVLAIAEGTSAGMQTCTLFICVAMQTLHTITTPDCASRAVSMFCHSKHTHASPQMQSSSFGDSKLLMQTCCMYKPGSQPKTPIFVQ